MNADAAGSDECREVADHELSAILTAHVLWLTSEGKEGTQANLMRACLRGRRLGGKRLERANLRDADLTGADLSGADLRGVHFGKAVLREASLHDADLHDADATDVVNLLPQQLAGADLTRARLPRPVAAFEGVKQADRIADNAQKLYIVLLSACAYSVLTIATTADAKLLTNTATSPLPIIQTAVPIAGFYWLAPALLAGTYFYLHLYLQRLWEALARLPAVFPDGATVDQKIDPWLLSGLIRRHVPRLSAERPVFASLHTMIAILSAWWVTPATLLLFWGRYLRRHEWGGTVLHVVLLGMTLAAAVLLYRIAGATLQRSVRREKLRRPSRWILVMIPTVAIAGLLSQRAIEGDYPVATRPFNRPWTWIWPRQIAHLMEAEVSVKPAGWADRREQIALVTGARLLGADLRGAHAARAFLINADLRSARLEGALMFDARLEGANLSGARLERANLSGARLEGADLSRARLEGADLSRVSAPMVEVRRAPK
jgi:uncharacterized protein YjbI with pentapeptide repeats